MSRSKEFMWITLPVVFFIYLCVVIALSIAHNRDKYKIVRDVLASIDADGGGIVTFGEYVAAGGFPEDFEYVDQDSSGTLNRNEIAQHTPEMPSLRHYLTLDHTMRNDVRIRILQLLCIPLVGLFASGIWLLIIFGTSPRILNICSHFFLHLMMATTDATAFIQWAWVMTCVLLGISVSTLVCKMKAGSGAVRASLLHK